MEYVPSLPSMYRADPVENTTIVIMRLTCEYAHILLIHRGNIHGFFKAVAAAPGEPDAKK